MAHINSSLVGHDFMDGGWMLCHPATQQRRREFPRHETSKYKPKFKSLYNDCTNIVHIEISVDIIIRTS